MTRRRRGSAQSTTPRWDFFSFPTYFGFAAGALVASTIIEFSIEYGYDLAGLVFFVSLFIFSFGAAHVLSRRLVESRRMRAQERADEEERERRLYAARAAATAQATPTPPRKR